RVIRADLPQPSVRSLRMEEWLHRNPSHNAETPRRISRQTREHYECRRRVSHPLRAPRSTRNCSRGEKQRETGSDPNLPSLRLCLKIRLRVAADLSFPRERRSVDHKLCGSEQHLPHPPPKTYFCYRVSSFDKGARTTR